MRAAAALLVAGLLALSPARAVMPGEQLADPVLEQRARALALEVRCLVCQNQSIDDSNAPLARDLRLIIRERLTAGDSDRQIRDFLVARYGEFVLLRPPFNARTALLWIAPGLALLFGIVVIRRFLRTPATVVPAVPPLSAEEQRRLAALMPRDPAARG